MTLASVQIQTTKSPPNLLSPHARPHAPDRSPVAPRCDDDHGTPPVPTDHDDDPRGHPAGRTAARAVATRCANSRDGVGGAIDGDADADAADADAEVDTGAGTVGTLP